MKMIPIPFKAKILKIVHKLIPLCPLILLVLLIMPDLSYAATTGSGMAWEDPLSKIQDSIKGPVAFAISLLGIIGAGATLIWGGEINEFIRKTIFLVLIISLIAFATTILSSLFGMNGAVIPG